MMAALKFVNIQGWLGIGSSVILAGLLGLTAYRADHWHNATVSVTSQLHAEQAAHRQTIINYQNAALLAHKEDAANVQRVKAQQAEINKRTESDYEARIADARARAGRVQQHTQPSANPGSRGTADVPGPVGAAGGPDGAAAENGLPESDRLIATEQAIQLDELIKWVGKNLTVDYSGSVGNDHPEMKR